MVKIDFRSLANSAIRELSPYQPDKPVEELERELGISASIKLASNENPLGPSPSVLLAAQAALTQTHIYPDGHCYEIKQALAAFLTVKPEHITVGNGSENILELIVKAYLHKDDSAIISEYVFLTIALLLQSYGVRTQCVAAKNFGHDIAAMIAAITAKTRVLFLVNPNNPTGTYTHADDFQRLMQAVPSHVLVVVDEAYAEYIAASDYPDVLAYLPHYPNLIVTRTFSKVYGLAALRLGYAVSSPEIADILNRARLPFNVNTVAAKAACAALQDQAHVRKSVALNAAGMQQMQEGLNRLHLPFIPSAGNFLAINVQDAATVYQKLLHAGVIVKSLQAYALPQHIRVTIGTAAQNERFLRAISAIV